MDFGLSIGLGLIVMDLGLGWVLGIGLSGDG